MGLWGEKESLCNLDLNQIQKNVNQNQTEQLVPQFTVLSRNNDSPTVLINEKLLLTLRHMCGILKLDSTTTHKSV